MTLHHGDCLDVMAQLDPDSIDAIVTDPPYGIRFMGKAWDGEAIEHAVRKRKPKDSERTYVRKDTGKPYTPGTTYADRASEAGSYDTSLSGSRAFQAWCEAWAREAFRIAKPGAHLLAFGGTRTYHRLAAAIEDAGWEVRDCLVWAYASGFPKSHNLDGEWQGWGTALKPAWEPIVLARKPLTGTVAANVQRHGTGALNIDGTRIPGVKPVVSPIDSTERDKRILHTRSATGTGEMTSEGRWPANVILTDPIFDGDTDGVVGGGESSPGTAAGVKGSSGFANGYDGQYVVPYGDTGTYSRFFLIPKAARSDREPVVKTLAARPASAPAGRADGSLDGPIPQRANVHPTVKPTELMRHLVRLVTPPGGTVLDPFLGSGTTALACEMEGFAWVGIEREEEYVRICEARLNGVQKGLGLSA